MLAETNKELLDTHFEFIYGIVKDRVYKILKYKITGKETPSDLIKKGLCDPVRVFIKNEPHSPKKLLEGRLRLISNVSLVDQVIDRIVSQVLNKREIACYKEIPSKPGIALTDEDAELLSEIVSKFPTLAEADMSSWDWTVQDWELRADGERRIRSLSLSRNSSAAILILFRSYAIARKVFVTSDGDMYEQSYPGIMASGWYNTSSTNSWIRVLAGRLLNPKNNIIANGDDSLESYYKNAQDFYRSLGHNCGNYVQRSGSFEFCSSWFEGGKCFPVNLSKSICNLLHNGGTIEERLGYVVQWAYEARHHPDLPRWLTIFKEIGYY